MNFIIKIKKIQKKNNSLICIGLDVDITRIPKFLKKLKDPVFEFNKKIIDSTHDLVCAYKPNIAFYEARGLKGLRSLKKTIKYLQNKYKDTPIILDAKRGDIGSSSKQYAKAFFEYWDVDAITVFPYLGLDSISSFLDYKNKYIFLLLKTSNPDSSMFQDLKLLNGKPFYLNLAKEISKWNNNNFGVFCGATYPKELLQIRKIFPNKVILTAGIGAQGGDPKKTVKAGVDSNSLNLICNSSRSIIYASCDKNFNQKARQATIKLRNIINKYR
ncbi:orotidine-5'-phosphate decarboxylase [Patescibacteria group bacterium]